MLQNILIIPLIWLSPIIGNWLAKICDEELKPGKKWFKKTIFWLMIINILIILTIPFLITKIYFLSLLIGLTFLGYTVKIKQNTQIYIILILNAITIPLIIPIIPNIGTLLIAITVLTFFIISALNYKKKIWNIDKKTIKKLTWFSFLYLFSFLLLLALRRFF